jgi:hypothetical protein
MQAKSTSTKELNQIGLKISRHFTDHRYFAESVFAEF